MAKLSHHPQIILLWVAQNYLSESEFRGLLDELGLGFKTDGKFLRTVLRHFDIDRIKRNRIHPLDDIFYNYLVYDCKGTKLPKNKLIARYEREVAIPAEKTMRELSLYARADVDN